MNFVTPYSWIKSHLIMDGNVFLCEVDKSYIRDIFNLTGLPDQVPHFRQALEKILNGDSIYKNEENCSVEDGVIENAAQLLYGLIHARYILTSRGIEKMMTKYDARVFGICPRVYCEGQALLPLGLIDSPGVETVKLYCPKCVDVYAPKENLYRNLDGAYFGTGFPHMLFMMFPDCRPQKPENHFTPKLCDFKIHELQAPGAGAANPKSPISEI